MQQAGAGSPTLTVVRQARLAGGRPGLDFGIELLGLAKTGRIGPALRLYRPAPTVAFGQRDTHLPASKPQRGRPGSRAFEPLVRKAGGRAAAYHEGTLIVDHVEPHADAIAGAKGRFAFFGEMLAEALRSAGVKAAVGRSRGNTARGSSASTERTRLTPRTGLSSWAPPSAWCPAGGCSAPSSWWKTRRPSAASSRPVTGALGLDWDPATAGAVNDLVPHLDVRSIEDAVIGTYGGYAPLAYAEFSSLRP